MKRSSMVILGLMVGCAMLMRVTDGAFRADRVLSEPIDHPQKASADEGSTRALLWPPDYELDSLMMIRSSLGTDSWKQVRAEPEDLNDNMDDALIQSSASVDSSSMLPTWVDAQPYNSWIEIDIDSAEVRSWLGLNGSAIPGQFGKPSGLPMFGRAVIREYSCNQGGVLSHRLTWAQQGHASLLDW